MKDHLLLQSRGKLYVFLPQGRTYYWILVDRHYTDEAEQILIRGDCSEGVMRELGLKFEAIGEENITSIDCTGYKAGSYLIFSIKNQKNRSYILSDDTDEAVVDGLFSSVTVRKSVTPERSHSSEEAILPERQGLRRLGGILNTGSLVLVLLSNLIGWNTILFLCGSYGIHLVTLILYLRYPETFTVFSKKKRKEAPIRNGKVDLTWGLIIVPMIMALMTYRTFNMERTAILYIAAFAWGLLFSGFLYFRSEEYRQKPSMMIVTAVATGMMVFGILSFVNHYACDLPPQKGTVLELRTEKSGRSRSYYCTIENSQGRKWELRLNKYDYRELDIGDQIHFYSGEGALGISYTCFWEKIQ